jgi:hypothetical protein
MQPALGFRTAALVASLALLCLGVGFVVGAPAEPDWSPKPGRLMTKWAKEVSPKQAHPEYPRPQMVRSAWLNLNGLWEYAIVPTNAPQPSSFQGRILVPFPAESALSGVMREVGEQNRLWYRRTFKVPSNWRGQQVWLHFGAVDWEASVWLNGRPLGTHQGGYDAFSFNLTDALKAGAEQELVVAVWDPSDAGPQPRGKQVRKPGGIWYTPSTGIWQTPWLEPVPETHVEALKITPDLDGGKVRIAITARNPEAGTVARILVRDKKKMVATVDLELPAGGDGGSITHEAELSWHDVKPWWPDTPFLYDLEIGLRRGGKTVDEVGSYFGMRKIALGKDDKGALRLFLNHQPLFQFGPLDQGFWPDGLYTAPTDEALRYDIEMTKRLGFNMARKHVKVEPERWYYWCDKLGLLVWQDMPSGDKSARWQGPSGFDGVEMQRSPESVAIYEKELKALIAGRYNHPCIVTWVPFNEGWGQFETERILQLAQQLDPSRLVDGASGGNHFPAGHILDHHQYPGPGLPRMVNDRARVLGEFGGLGLPVGGHTWQEEKNWGYRSFKTREDLTDAYVALIRRLRPLTGDPGLAAAIYTQTTDVEVEVNGLMTYDRALVKMDEATVRAANESVYSPPLPRPSSGTQLNPPATPLVACDPYFSIWSPADKLTDEETVHWTGKRHRLRSRVEVDEKSYRVMGASPSTLPALTQRSLRVLPTRTIYTFAGAGIELTLTFLTAALPEDIALLSRPVTYVTYDVRSTDGKTHVVSVVLDVSGEIAVNTPNQEVETATEVDGPVMALKIGSTEQPVLAKKGDDLRIDWGYLYLAGRKADGPTITVTGPKGDSGRRGPAEEIGGSFRLKLGNVTAQPVSRWLMLAYDDLYSIQYMHRNLRPYWRRAGWNAGDLLQAAASEYASLRDRCEAFDAELMADLTQAGGEKYAKLAALAYRQCFAAGKFVADDNGQPLQFCKENHSNGCIGTSDVFYPMSPQFLLFGPSLAKAFLVPFMQYAASPRWRFPFAPHDLGTYPKANGQVYGGGERTEENQMPVEESGNLLLLMAAIAQMEGQADFAGLYWPQLEQWAAYLKAKGFDPENQLCTDDFAGHLAHNVNLSAKAICALGAFSKLCELRGDKAKAAEYRTLAADFATRWVREGQDGDHFRLAFDKPGTWSQKYNLIWDGILVLRLFPSSALQLDMAYYRKIQNRYGLPLDNRQSYTKLDWILWTATLTRERADFEALVDPVCAFLNETPDLSPMTDWYQTKTARKVGFTARPVVGGVFAQMLYRPDTWQKYARRDQTKAAKWAAFPTPPVTKTVVPTAREDENLAWRYTTQRPAEGWMKPEYEVANWSEGKAGFGTQGTPGAVVRTEWRTGDIWLRRSITLPDPLPSHLALRVHHDEDVEIYVNGVRAASASGYTADYEELPLSATGRAALRPGQNILAIHCHQTTGGQYVDAGLVTIEEAARP